MDVLRNAGSIEMHHSHQDRKIVLMPEEKIFNFYWIISSVCPSVQLTPQLSVQPGFGSHALPPTVNILKN